MNKKQKAASQQPSSNNCHKDNTSSRHIKETVRNMFLIHGMKYTAAQINQFIEFSDARKVISTLRREGMNIKDVRKENGCKIYWLEKDSQLNIWEGNL
jgi:hypothetical protein